MCIGMLDAGVDPRARQREQHCSSQQQYSDMGAQVSHLLSANKDNA
jgi:hypothetical protein